MKDIKVKMGNKLKNFAVVGAKIDTGFRKTDKKDKGVAWEVH
jgi:hypothetical protein